MANLLNFLLNEELADVSSYAKDVEIPRLSKKMDGGKFVIKVRALTTKETDALPFDKKGTIDMGKLRRVMLGYGVTNAEFNDNNLLKKYRVATKADLLEKILLPGEVTMVINEIQKLCGFVEEDKAETIEYVKN